MSVKALLEKRSEVHKELRRQADISNDDKHVWTPDDNVKWQEINAEYDALSARITRAKRAEEVTAADVEIINRGRKATLKEVDGGIEVDDEVPDGATEKEEAEERDERSPFHGARNYIRTNKDAEYDRAFRAWAMFRRGDLSSKQRDLCKRLGFNPSLEYVDVPLRRGNYRNLVRKFKAEERALSTTLTAGGDTIPEGFVTAFERAMLFFGGMREAATVIRTETGNALPWPTTNDTTQTGALLAENAAVSEQDIVTGAIILNAFKYTSKLVRVSVELLEDNAVDLPSVLGAILGERIGRITNNHFTVGTGSAQPNGAVTASSVGATLPAGNTLGFATVGIFDSIIDLFHSVDRAYRPGASFMFRDSNLASLRKVKDTTNQYIWQAGTQAGEPDRILGAPVTINNDIAAFAANAKVALFGLMTKYLIRDVAGFRLRRLVERYADNDQEGFVAFSRHDGELLDAGVKPIKHLAASAT